MDLTELNDKLRKQLMNMKGVNREKVIAEIAARDRFLAELGEKMEVRCSCGLVMSRRNYYEHREDTEHDVQQEPRDNFPRHGKESSNEPQLETGEGLRVCSCGLIMSGTNFREHQKETRHTSHPRQLRRSNTPRPLRKAGSFSATPLSESSIAGPDSLIEP